MAALRYMLFSTTTNARRAARPFYGPGLEPEPDFVELLSLGYRHVRLDVDLRGLPVVTPEALAGFQRPSCVVYGACDVFFPVERAVRRAREVLPVEPRVEVVPDQGHVLTAGAERALYRRVEEFLLAQKA